MVVAAMLLCGLALAAPKTSHDGPRWRLENASLRVDIDTQRGSFEVLDKRARYRWRRARW
jgi:hypothetical protein